MSQMDYFRRPALAGKNIQHPATGRVRGNIRRSDADGTSAVPYFPTVAPADTLNIETDAGAVSVALTANDLNTILSNINTALGAAGAAYSENGCIGLATNTAGATGFVRVTGGTASAALGFNTFGGTLSIEGHSSDLNSAPEGDLGNPFGVVFPRRENLSSDVLTRNLGRLASNTDVLWSDHVKNSISFETVAFVVGAGGAFLTPTSTQRFFVGGGLTAASTRKQLAAYYQIIDQVTGLPANSQVAAVVRGTPVGSPPYANSPSWSDVTGKNVLGVGANGQEKVSSAGITTITAGRFIECAGATFVTNGVVAGDYAQIVSATNLTPSSNNGMKWVVEFVLSETVLALRPMSKSELDSTGFYTFPIKETQPIVELNDSKSGLEVFGALVIKTGPFAHNVTLVVAPPIPTNATYELRAAVPSSLRDDKSNAKQLGVAAVLSELGGDLDPTDNWILDGFNPGLVGASCEVAEGYVRQHGKVFRVPAVTFAVGNFSNGVNYIYWSETTGGLAITASVAAFGDVLNDTYAVASSNRGHPVAKVTVALGSITSVERMVRRRAEKAIIITVGASGQFRALEDAVLYANAISAASLEAGSAAGLYPHFEFVLTNNIILAANITFTIPSVVVRGVNDRVQLTTGVRTLSMAGNCTSLLIKDLLIVGSAPQLVRVEGIATRSVVLQNIEHGGNFEEVIRTVGVGTLRRVEIFDSSIGCNEAIIRGNGDIGGVNEIRLKNSSFYFGGGGSGAPTLIRQEAVATWAGHRVEVDGCVFRNPWITSSAVNALFIAVTSSTYGVMFRNCSFELGNHASTSNAFLFSLVGTALLEKVTIVVGKIPKAVVGDASTVIRDCAFRVNPEGTAIGVRAANVENTIIAGLDTTASTVGGIGLEVLRLARSNTLTGTFASGIRTAGDNIIVTSNKVTLTNGTAYPLIGIEGATENSCLISENTISMPVRPVGAVNPPAGIAQTGAPLYRLSILNNFVTMAENGSGIRVGTAVTPRDGEELRISGNQIQGTCTVGGVISGIDLHGNVVSCEVSHNRIAAAGAAGAGNGIFQDDGTYTQFVVQGNQVYVDATYGASGGLFYCATPDATHTLTGNIFKAATVTQRVSGFRGITSGNQFLGASTFLLSDLQGVFCDNYVSVALGAATLGPGRYDNNTFIIPNVNASVTTSDFQFTNNRVSGAYNGTTTTNTFTMFSGNKVAGATTIDAGSDTKVLVTGNELLGAFTLIVGSNAHDVILSSTYVGGNFVAEVNKRLNISNCIFAGTGTQTILVGEAVEVVGNNFAGRVSMNGPAPDQLVSNNKLAGGIAFTYDASPAFWKIDGNRIQSIYNVTSVEFPAFSLTNQLFITISNNTIQHGCGEDAIGLAATVSAIHFAGNVGTFSVVGNNIAIGRNNTKSDPGGGAGTTNVACLRIVGVGAGNGPNVISSNYMDIPSTLVFTHTYVYKFWYFGSATNTGGAGNILVQNNSVAAGTPYDGSQFFSAGIVSPYNKP